MFAEPAHHAVLCEIAKRIGRNVEIDRDCSRRAVSLSCEVEFQMAPNLPEQPAARPHQQDFCRVSGGNSLPNDENDYVGILLDLPEIAKARKIVIVLIVA